MNITSTITKTVAGVATLAAATIGIGVATPQAEAYSTIDANPSIGCMAGLLEIHGRAVSGSYQGERVYSMFDIYVWTSSGWQLDERTEWRRLDVDPYYFAGNDYFGVKDFDTYYAAVEHIASWDGTQWQFDSALTSLMSNFASFGGHYGSDYYARCS